VLLFGRRNAVAGSSGAIKDEEELTGEHARNHSASVVEGDVATSFVFARIHGQSQVVGIVLEVV